MNENNKENKKLEKISYEELKRKIEEELGKKKIDEIINMKKQKKN